MKTVRDFAKEVLRPYVLRGDSMDWVASGQLGVSSTGYSFQLGGYLWYNDKMVKKLDKYEIGINEWNGKQMIVIYKLKDIWNEILAEKIGIQLALI